MSEPKYNKDSMKNILIVSLLVCLFCSVVVSSAAVFLKPQRLANKDLDRNKNILEAAGLYDKQSGVAVDIAAEFEKFEIHVVDLQDKRVLSDIEAIDLGIEARTYDQRKAAKDPAVSKTLETGEDIASISRRARYSVVYLLREADDIKKIVIPVHGYGLWSTLYGFIALDGDMNTVSGITFYEHGETAGLGGEVDNPAWKALWSGKMIYDDEGVALKVIKGNARADSPQFNYQIDGLSGATLTSRGVQNLVGYWLGDDGFGPILDGFRG
ncbi:MAG: Na(+)-translocating NADH-quinone reductase subunit C [Candidatus Azotimanducaceae bacterium WSBS_2022_MAG_OTU7]